MATTTKIRISDLDEQGFSWLGLAWWDTRGASRDDLAMMRRDNAATLATLIGKRFYLIERDRQLRPLRTTYVLSEEPGRTNMSHDPRVKGWLGSTDNISRRALGYFEVVGQSRTHLHLTEVASEETQHPQSGE